MWKQPGLRVCRADLPRLSRNEGGCSGDFGLWRFHAPEPSAVSPRRATAESSA